MASKDVLYQFPCILASSTPIPLVTKEVRYIHALSLTLEHSMPMSSPAVPGLTFHEHFFWRHNELKLSDLTSVRQSRDESVND